jgi:hypothetical protein
VGSVDFCTERKAAEARDDHSPSSIAKIKYEWNYSSTLPYKFREGTGITLNYYLVTMWHIYKTKIYEYSFILMILEP